MGNLYLGLVHYPVYNKHMQVIATAVTNFDIHDIARTAYTYGVRRYYLIHPLAAQAQMIQTVIDYWQTGFGSTYNPDRKEALSIARYAPDIAQAIAEITAEEGVAPATVTTDARIYPNTVQFSYLRKKLLMEPQPIFLLLGTGFGLENKTMEQFDYILEPIWGPTEYNHLCVRSAAAIMLDRIRGGA